SSRFMIIASEYPEPDKASGALRLFTLVSLLARHHCVLFAAVEPNGALAGTCAASANLESVGVEIARGALPAAVAAFAPEIVMFEFYHQAREDFVNVVRRGAPGVRVLVDSVDLHFVRFEAQARLSGDPEDVARAQRTRTQELAAYRRADMTIAVSRDEESKLRELLPGRAVTTIPNIHAIHPYLDLAARNTHELVFVGGFRHEPNVDAVRYFCTEVMPRILARYPTARLTIIGSHPPSAVTALAGPAVDVVGYVPETAPYLQRACISVAPLRFGGGMKGKVGEAMSFGLPVVTTSFGAEGFGLVPGEHLLVGDDPATFADHVVALLEDPARRDAIGRAGHRFISEHYSLDAVAAQLDDLIMRARALRPASAPPVQRLFQHARTLFDRHVGWRLR
ncbi:MAG: glycosyltransferase, partial [Acetobacteraceae bacterium]